MGQFSIVNSFITVISPLEPWAPTVVTTIFIFRFGFYFARHHENESPSRKTFQNKGYVRRNSIVRFYVIDRKLWLNSDQLCMTVEKWPNVTQGCD